LEAIASTEAAEIGTATVDIRAFQPFFVDHVPPRVLTLGDEIQFPVTVRNYLNREQHINLALRAEKWFDVAGSRERDMRIAPNASATQVFSIRATGTVVDGKQRITAQVTAQGTGPGDAIEKPITVHPDGREINQTLNAVVGDSVAIELVIPEQSIPGSVNAERLVVHSGNGKVLGAILAASGGPVLEEAGGPADILVNGRIVASLTMPPVREIAGPLRVDLSPYVSRGVNRISVRRSQGRSPAQFQVAAAYYVPWTEEMKATDTGELRLQVAFDKTVLKPGDEITCRVRAERVGSGGLGMMVAEIGLPPGVDVDRHSLDDAVASSGYAFSQYDILPDNVILYVWPRAGGTSFAFRFRPRMAMQAKSAESVLYDYYNPEARVVIQSVRFRVESAAGGTSSK
jgi:hypothetical protein